MDVSPRSVRRDITLLKEMGFEIESDRGVGGGYRLVGGAHVAPVLFDEDEAVVIAAELCAAAHAGAGHASIALRALVKLVQTLPPQGRERVRAVTEAAAPGAVVGVDVKVDVMVVLAQACRDQERVQFVFGESRPQVVTVDPLRLSISGRDWHLIGQDITEDRWREFPLRFIADPVPVREASGAGEVSEVVRRLPLPDEPGWEPEPRYRVSLLIGAPLEAVVGVQRYSGGEFSRVTANQCRFVVDVEEFDWIVHIMAAVGKPFEVESPPELREHLARTGALLTRASLTHTPTGSAVRR